MIGLLALAVQPFSLEIDVKMNAYRACLANALARRAEPTNLAEAQTAARVAIVQCRTEREAAIGVIAREIAIHFPNVDARRQAEQNVTQAEQVMPDVWSKEDR